MSKKVIGIDLASSMSVVCVMENGKPTVVVNEEGGYSTPSVISLKDGERKIGSAAKRQRVVNPKETINLIKRFMGLSFDECKEGCRPCPQADIPEEGISSLFSKGFSTPIANTISTYFVTAR